MNWLVFIVNYFVLINIATLVVMRVDLARAKREKSRIPEEVIFGLAVIGGSLGAMIGADALGYKSEKHAIGDMLRAATIIQVLVFLFLVAVFLF